MLLPTSNTLAVVNPTTFAAYNPVQVVAKIIFVDIKLAPTINPPPFPIIVFAKTLPAVILPVVLIMLLPKLTNAAATFEDVWFTAKYSKTFERTRVLV